MELHHQTKRGILAIGVFSITSKGGPLKNLISYNVYELANGIFDIKLANYSMVLPLIEFLKLRDKIVDYYN